MHLDKFEFLDSFNFLKYFMILIPHIACRLNNNLCKIFVIKLTKFIKHSNNNNFHAPMKGMLYRNHLPEKCLLFS